jgi:hypothetical protein
MPDTPREIIRPSLPPVMPAKPSMIAGQRWVRLVFWCVAGLMALFVFGAFLLPKEVTVSRSTVIRAKPAEVFTQVETLKNWENWGPWFERDPFLEKTYTGPESGTGAMLAWKSNKEGDGRLKIIAAHPPGSLRLAVEFGAASGAEMSFDISSTGDGSSEVKWTLHADFGGNMARRYFGLLMPKFAGGDMEEGLASLKQLLEKSAAP